MSPKKSRCVQDLDQSDEQDKDEQDNEEDNTLRILDRGVQKEAKICVVCQRPFTWRKKWERCWSEVTTCSDACKRQRKQEQKRDHRNGKTTGKDSESCVDKEDGKSQDEKSHDGGRNNPALADRKDKVRTKMCFVCKQEVQLAYRCKFEERQRDWRFVCRPCWPMISGSEYLEKNRAGVDVPPAGDVKKIEDVKGESDKGETDATVQSNIDVGLGNPYYVYGGTWKSVIGMTKSECASSS